MKKLILLVLLTSTVLSCKKKEIETEEATVKCEVQMTSFPYKPEQQRFVVLLNDVKVETPSAFFAKSGDKIEAHAWNDYHPTASATLRIFTENNPFSIEVSNSTGKPISNTIYVP
jgi:hypothetical protein